MPSLLDSLFQLFHALGDVIVQLGENLVPFLPLVAWVAFWTFAVNWVKLRAVLLQGGWVGLVLIGLVAVLVWGAIAPPEADAHHFLGLTLTNFVGKTVLVTTLICIMLLCGSVQLSGVCGSLAHFPEPEPEEHHAAGHDDHGGAHSHEGGHDEHVATAHH